MLIGELPSLAMAPCVAVALGTWTAVLLWAYHVLIMGYDKRHAWCHPSPMVPQPSFVSGFLIGI